MDSTTTIYYVVINASFLTLLQRLVFMTSVCACIDLIRLFHRNDICLRYSIELYSISIWIGMHLTENINKKVCARLYICAAICDIVTDRKYQTFVTVNVAVKD